MDPSSDGIVWKQEGDFRGEGEAVLETRKIAEAVTSLGGVCLVGPYRSPGAR